MLIMDYSKHTYEELIREEGRLEERRKDIEDECLKEGKSFSEYCERAHDILERLYFISKYKRVKQEPVIEYGKEWNGDMYTIEEFKEMCQKRALIDDDGYGNYATETSKSDVEILPSDVTENIIRTDFPYVIWFNK